MFRIGGVRQCAQRHTSCIGPGKTQREVGVALIERQQVVVEEVFRGKAEFQVLVLRDLEGLLRCQIAFPERGTVDGRHAGIADPRALERVSEAVGVGELVFVQSHARIAGNVRSDRDIRRTDAEVPVRAILHVVVIAVAARRQLRAGLDLAIPESW